MSADLTARLRNADIGLCDEAADEIDRLRDHFEELDHALLEIWQLTNLPFADDDRHEIQRLALQLHNRMAAVVGGES